MTARFTVLAVALALAACGEQEPVEPPPPRGIDQQSAEELEPQPYVEMTLRRPSRRISGDDVLISGTVAPKDATVTVRGEPAVVKNGEYRLRLKAEARCGPLDPTRFDEDGNYIPLPGC